MTESGAENRVCVNCNYDLRGINSERCPECGEKIEWNLRVHSQIPWENQKTRGWFRGFWDTTGWVFFHPYRLAAEMDRPVKPDLAREFQIKTVLLGWSASTAWIVAAMGILEMPDWPKVASALVWGQFLALASSTGSFWFRPNALDPVRRKRAIALSCYVCAPLAWLWLPGVMTLPLLMNRFNFDLPGPTQAAVFLGVILFVTLITHWFINSCYLMAKVTGCDAGRAFSFGTALGVIWILCLLVSTVLPALVFLTKLGEFLEGVR